MLATNNCVLFVALVRIFDAVGAMEVLVFIFNKFSVVIATRLWRYIYTYKKPSYTSWYFCTALALLVFDIPKEGIGIHCVYICIYVDITFLVSNNIKYPEMCKEKRHCLYCQKRQRKSFKIESKCYNDVTQPITVNIALIWCFISSTMIPVCICMSCIDLSVYVREN